MISLLKEEVSSLKPILYFLFEFFFSHNYQISLIQNQITQTCLTGPSHIELVLSYITEVSYADPSTVDPDF